MTEYIRFRQSDTSVTPTPMVTLGSHKDVVNFLKDPGNRAKFLPISKPESKSLPARVGEILFGIVS